MIADEFNRLAKIIDGSLVLALLNVCDAESEVSFCQPAPLAGLAIALQRPM